MAAKGTPPGPLGAPLDDASLEEGFRDHRDTLFRFLLRRTRHAERAEDLTQQVFLEAARDRPRVGAGEPPLLAWLYTVARRRYLDEQDRPVPVPLVEAELVSTDEGLQYGRQVAHAIRVGMQRLSPEHRDVLSRRLLEGVPFAELAARYGMTEGAVKMRFTRGLAELQRELARLGVER
ncbi:MAG: polymerase sigma-70 factor, subfamily [Gaiellales bacterium]|jgi:RNA polymerase sigma-70 factor (ECF subfamily)|nr:polymerase sigma-70 factor, subfamily [Gaiellales bacterium]